MRSALFLTLVVVFITACGTAAPPLPEEKAALIPQGANRLIMTSEWPVDTLFARVKRHLYDDGFDIIEEDLLTKRVVTSSQEIGQRAKMSITLRMSPVEEGSQMEALAQWFSDIEEADMATVGRDISSQNQNWAVATWKKTSRDSYAYAQLLLIFERMPHLKIDHLAK